METHCERAAAGGALGADDALQLEQGPVRPGGVEHALGAHGEAADARFYGAGASCAAGNAVVAAEGGGDVAVR